MGIVEGQEMTLAFAKHVTGKSLQIWEKMKILDNKRTEK